MSNFSVFKASRMPRPDPIPVSYFPSFVPSRVEANRYNSVMIRIQKSFELEIPREQSSESEEEVIKVPSSSDDDVNIIG